MRRGHPSLFLVGILSVAGIALSTLSLSEYWLTNIARGLGGEHSSSFCNINSNLNCAAVSQSSWALWFGIPVAAYGLWFYLTLFLSCLLFSDEDHFFEDEVNDFLAFMSFVGIVVSAILFFISKFKLDALCPLCLGVYAVNLVLFLAVIVKGQKRKSWVRASRDGIFVLLGLLIEGLSFQIRNRGAVIKLFGLAVILAGLFSYALNDVLKGRQVTLVPGAFAGDSNNIPTRSNVSPLALDLSSGPNRDYYQGPLQAPIQVVEFADYECPACQVLYLVISELLERYSGKVQYVFKNYPLDMSCNPALKQDMHKNACYLSYVARCAGEQGKFWEMSDYLFRIGMEERSMESSALKSKISNEAVRLKLNKATLEQCVAGEDVKAKIKSDIEEGDRLGLEGTPTILVNGKVIKDLSYDGLDKVFASIVNSAGGH